MKKFSYKRFCQGNDILLAIADIDIVGKTFKEKGLEITISKEFYHEELCDKEKALELMKRATMINAMGKDVIDFMVKNNFVKKENVLKPCGVPHAQVIGV